MASTSASDPFGARTRISTALGERVVYRLDAGLGDVASRCRTRSRCSSRRASATSTASSSPRTTSRRSPTGTRRRSARSRSRSCPGASCSRTSPACRRSSISPRMRSAMKRHRRRPEEDQPARPVRPRHRPLACRSTPSPRRIALHHQRREGVRAQPRALRVPQVGPAGASTTSASSRRRPASSTRSTSSTSPRCVLDGQRSDGTRRLPRLARRHRHPHHDDQRPGRRRLGRRRHRGRGRHARPADLHADRPRSSASS